MRAYTIKSDLVDQMMPTEICHEHGMQLKGALWHRLSVSTTISCRSSPKSHCQMPALAQEGGHKLLPEPGLFCFLQAHGKQGAVAVSIRGIEDTCQKGTITSYRIGQLTHTVMLSVWLSCLCLKKGDPKL